MNPIAQIWQAPPLRVPFRDKPEPLTTDLRGPRCFKRAVNAFVAWMLKAFEMKADDFREVASPIQMVSVDRREIGNSIIRHLNEYTARYNDWPDRVLIGRDQYEQLVSGELNTIMMFRADVKYVVTVDRRFGIETFRFSGVNVVLIPWMSGIIALPKMVIESPKEAFT